MAERGIMDDTKFCPSCGDQVPVTTKYCDNCGYAFPKETIPGASVYTPPVMNVQPAVNNAPMANEQPAVNNVPVANAQPAVNNVPEANVQTAINNVSAESAQPTVNNVPTVNEQPVANNVPIVNAQPVEDNTPAANTPSMANITPTENINAAPIETAKPVVNEIPAANTPSMANITPTENVNAAPMETAKTVANDTSAEIAQPVVNSSPVMSTAPIGNGMPEVSNTQPVADSKENITIPGENMQGNQFGTQMPTGQMNGPQMSGVQQNGSQMNGQQQGGPALMNPAYATATPPEKPKGNGCLIAILVAIMIVVIVAALVASAALATQIEGLDDLISGNPIGGTHSLVLSDTETVYMEVGDTHTITVENIDDFLSPRDIDWEVAGGGYYSNDVVSISDNYDGSVTVTAMNPGKTSIIVTGKNVDKEEGYIVKIDVSEKNIEYGSSLSGGEFAYAGTAWETEWAQYYFVGPESKDPVIEQLEYDWGINIMNVNDGCLMISDYMNDYAYGDVTCTKVSENDLYASSYYNDIAGSIVPGAEYYWFTYVPEVEVLGNSVASGNLYDVIFMFQPDGTLVIYDSGFGMLSAAEETSEWPSYADLDRRFNIVY
ncbi:MAG: hypothetical protein K6G19_07675 [Lachnospiraceae bacterium]|nr:hypothetical protein [Lachnospiraceae bacterium]